MSWLPTNRTKPRPLYRHLVGFVPACCWSPTIRPAWSFLFQRTEVELPREWLKYDCSARLPVLSSLLLILDLSSMLMPSLAMFDLGKRFTKLSHLLHGHGVCLNICIPHLHYLVGGSCMLSVCMLCFWGPCSFWYIINSSGNIPIRKSTPPTLCPLLLLSSISLCA